MAVMLADSDVLIDFLRGRSPVAEAVQTALRAGRLATSAVSAFELSLGARSEKQAKDVSHLLDLIDVRPLDRAAAEIAGRLQRELRARGLTIPYADLLIAGISISDGLPLWTNNRPDFEPIPGLLFFNA